MSCSRLSPPNAPSWWKTPKTISLVTDPTHPAHPYCEDIWDALLDNYEDCTLTDFMAFTSSTAAPAIHAATIILFWYACHIHDIASFTNAMPPKHSHTHRRIASVCIDTTLHLIDIDQGTSLDSRDITHHDHSPHEKEKIPLPETLWVAPLADMVLRYITCPLPPPAKTQILHLE